MTWFNICVTNKNIFSSTKKGKYEYKYIGVEKKAKKKYKYIRVEKKKNTNMNSLWLTKKGEYKYNLYLQIWIQIQIFVTHCNEIYTEWSANILIKYHTISRECRLKKDATLIPAPYHDMALYIQHI